MALSDVSILKGLKNLTVYDRDTRVPKYILRVASEMSIEPKVEEDELKVGGVVWDSDIKEASYELKFTAYEYPVAVVEHMTGGIKTTYVSDASGEVVDEENVNGITAYSATTGISAVALSGTTEAKWGEYVVKAKTASTVSVYAMSNVSFNDGTDEDYTDDTLLIADDLSISNSGDTQVPNFGFYFTGGSAVAMTIGDTFRFRIRRPNKSGYKVVVGGLNTEWEDVGIIGVPAKKKDIYRMIDVFKVKISGLPYSLKDGEYSSYQVTAKLQYDSSKGGYFELISE
jgi:hypothetical protein